MMTVPFHFVTIPFERSLANGANDLSPYLFMERTATAKCPHVVQLHDAS